MQIEADRAHIRLPDTTQTYCGTAGESMSLAFWFNHVMPNRDGCCQQLFRRLCPACDKLIPFTPVGGVRSVRTS